MWLLHHLDTIHVLDRRRNSPLWTGSGRTGVLYDLWNVFNGSILEQEGPKKGNTFHSQRFHSAATSSIIRYIEHDIHHLMTPKETNRIIRINIGDITQVMAFSSQPRWKTSPFFVSSFMVYCGFKIQPTRMHVQNATTGISM